MVINFNLIPFRSCLHQVKIDFKKGRKIEKRCIGEGQQSVQEPAQKTKFFYYYKKEL